MRLCLKLGGFEFCLSSFNNGISLCISVAFFGDAFLIGFLLGTNEFDFAFTLRFFECFGS